MTRPAAPHPAHGYTLLEMVVSLAIAAIVFVALGSTMFIAGKATPNSVSENALGMRSAETLQRVVEDLRAAVAVMSRTSTSITFTIQDRDADNRLETITYSWSGVVGGPLMRKVNSAAAVAVVDDVWQFNLVPDERTSNDQYTAAPLESAEVELFKYEDTSSLSDRDIRHDKWWSQYFKPALTSDIVGWRINRVKIQAKRDGSAEGIIDVRLAAPDASRRPTTTILEQATLTELSLTSSHAWYDVLFSGAATIPAWQGVCVTFSSTVGNAGKLNHKGSNVSGVNVALSEGPSWNTPDTDKCLLMYVYGTRLTQPSPYQSVIRTYLTGLTVSLQVGESAAGQAQTTAQLLNAPEVLTQQWETDFSVNPTTLDLATDGQMDFAASGFDTTTLVAGTWRADRTLRTAPDSDLSGVTTVDCLMRDTVPGDSGPGLRMNVGRAADMLGIIEVIATLQSNNTQTLVVQTANAAGGMTVLGTFAHLPPGWLNVRLITDPARRSVNVRVNDHDRGSFNYLRVTAAGAARGIETYRAGPGAEFDHVRVRNGGASNNPPNAVATANQTRIDEGETVIFSAASSSDLDGDPMTYHWTFGDGASASGVSASRRYDYDGLYTVVLTASDNKGGSSTAKLTIEVDENN